MVILIAPVKLLLTPQNILGVEAVTSRTLDVTSFIRVARLSFGMMSHKYEQCNKKFSAVQIETNF